MDFTLDVQSTITNEFPFLPATDTGLYMEVHHDGLHQWHQLKKALSIALIQDNDDIHWRIAAYNSGQLPTASGFDTSKNQTISYCMRIRASMDSYGACLTLS